jgi:hypothetical protein
VILVFIIYSTFFRNLKEQVKLYFLLENILICEIATDVAYGALHIEYFCGDFFQE